MKNKVSVKIIIPEIDQEYDVYLPINQKIGHIINLLNQTISELSNGEYKLSQQNKLYNAITNEKYLSDVTILNSNIRNGSILVLIS